MDKLYRLNQNGNIKQNSPFANYIIGTNSADTSGVWFYAYESSKAQQISQVQTYLTRGA